MAEPQSFSSDPPEADGSWIMAVIIGVVVALMLAGGGLWWVSSIYDNKLIQAREEMMKLVAAAKSEQPDLSKPISDLTTIVADMQKAITDLEEKQVAQAKTIKDDKYEIYLLWKNVGRMKKKLAAMEEAAATPKAEMTIPGVPYDQIAPVPAEPPAENQATEDAPVQ